MKSLNKSVLKWGLIAVALLGLFPPWLYTVERSGTRDSSGAHSTTDAGYHFILTPPAARQQRDEHGVRLDVARLIIEWVCVAALTVCTQLILSAKPSKSKPLVTDTERDEPSVETPPYKTWSSVGGPIGMLVKAWQSLDDPALYGISNDTSESGKAQENAPSTLLSARAQHYNFAHKRLPQAFFSDPAAAVCSLRTEGALYLKRLWDSCHDP